MNELVHGQWFEEQFHDPSYSEKLFTQVHQLDPDPVLMLNDFGVIARPEITDVSACRTLQQRQSLYKIVDGLAETSEAWKARTLKPNTRPNSTQGS